jgi:hypothetical protein
MGLFRSERGPENLPKKKSVLQKVINILMRDLRFLTAMKIHVEVLCFVTPCSLVVSYHSTTRRHNREDFDFLNTR